jgi:hypothetical protein
MPHRTWFIGSRRRYSAPPPRTPLERLDPAEFRNESQDAADTPRRREYELEVLERVIDDLRDPGPRSESE